MNEMGKQNMRKLHVCTDVTTYAVWLQLLLTCCQNWQPTWTRRAEKSKEKAWYT